MSPLIDNEGKNRSYRPVGGSYGRRDDARPTPLSHNKQEYKRRKPKTPPLPPKRCRVLHAPSAIFMDYDEKDKFLFHNPGQVYGFVSHRQAHRAKWHTCQKRAQEENADAKELWQQYEIVDA